MCFTSVERPLLDLLISVSYKHGVHSKNVVDNVNHMIKSNIVFDELSRCVTREPSPT